MTTQKSKVQMSVSSLAGNSALPIIQKGEEILVDARLLHKELKTQTRFNDWITRQIKHYEFKLNEDYYSNLSNQKSNQKHGGDRRSIDYYLTLDMAKELCMVERCDIGRKFRKYFIEAEKELRTKRLYNQTSSITEVIKQVKPININGRKLYRYRKVQQVLGFSTTGSTNNVRNVNTGLIVVLEGISYVAEEYVKLMLTRATQRVVRQEAVMAKPVLQLDMFAGGANG